MIHIVKMIRSAMLDEHANGVLHVTAAVVFAVAFAYWVSLMLGVAGHAVAPDNGVQGRIALQQLQQIHNPQSLDRQLTRLTKDLELTSEQQGQARPLLEEHHDKIQALLDRNPTVSRIALSRQIRAISDETHHEIHVLLTDHQKELETAMQRRENNGQENRRSKRS